MKNNKHPLRGCKPVEWTPASKQYRHAKQAHIADDTLDDALHDCQCGDARWWNFEKVFINGVNMETHIDTSESKG